MGGMTQSNPRRPAHGYFARFEHPALEPALTCGHSHRTTRTALRCARVHSRDGWHWFAADADGNEVTAYDQPELFEVAT